MSYVKDFTADQFREMDPTEKTKALKPIIDLLEMMLKAGTLKKNAVLHLTNKGIAKEVAEDLVRVACARAEDFSHYRYK